MNAVLFDSWVLADPPDPAALPRFGHPLLMPILARRGVTTEEEFRRFVAPTLGDLHDPATIHGMDFACQRIARAIRDHEAIAIYGDYDVDGVTSIVLLQTVLRTLGADVGFVVPQRLIDGYGLKTEVLDRILADRDVKLVITVDCGITSVEPVLRAVERGIDVIITDHHLPPGTLPDAAAVLNPKQPGCSYPFKDLAGVGVAFKLCCELLRRAGQKMSVESLLKIAAIGTIADVAPLIGENRAIAWMGLRGLADVRNAGLRTLLRRIGIYGRPLRSSDIGFKVGPRINAAGRLASADTAIDLFSSDEEAAWGVCAELDRMNTERQAIEKEVRTMAIEQVAGDERVIIVAGEGWHRGVIGLTAGRIAQAYHRPTLAIAIDGDTCVGSARSIPTIDLHAQLAAVADLFTHFGGHEFACGFSLPAANLPQLRTRLAAAFTQLDGAAFVRTAVIDGELDFDRIDAELIAAHELLEPFGAGNPRPLFLLRRNGTRTLREFSERCFEVKFDEGSQSPRGVVWPSAAMLAPLLESTVPVELLVHVDADERFPNRGRLEIVDARPAN